MAAAYRKLRLISAGLIASGILLLAGQNPPPDAALIVQKSVSVNTADWNAQPRYLFHERDMKSKVLSNGTVRDRQSKTYEVLIIDGSPYYRLTQLQDEPLSPEREQQEQRKYEREVSNRRNESPSERHLRVTKYQDGRAEEHLLMQQMVKAFDFKFVREEQIEGVDCYLLEATPNPDYRPPVEKARVLTGMKGHLWIEKTAYHWVKVEAQVVDPVSVGFFIAQVKPGTRFELEQAPVDNVWLPNHFSESVNASVFGFYEMRSRSEERYSDYKLINTGHALRGQVETGIAASGSRLGGSRAH
ncbi:MAG: hypothetical protein JO138_05490 [Acidobacteriaceae bacterium]|nr:hypothetical protein [Acidobacteriaceae bacterium]